MRRLTRGAGGGAATSALGQSDEKHTDESTSCTVKYGEEKLIQREPQKTLRQTSQRHRNEKSVSTTRPGSC
ncbi:hypothetical protein MC885_007188 [Smutsia gigantea]|nr:hypothetical protein MC885_007188 [Smutsia gigantea]